VLSVDAASRLNGAKTPSTSHEFDCARLPAMETAFRGKRIRMFGAPRTGKLGHLPELLNRMTTFQNIHQIALIESAIIEVQILLVGSQGTVIS